MASWDVIVVSASTQLLANAACDELRASSPDVNGAKLLAVADPSETHRVGSGGAAINALLVVGEELSARGGLTTLSAEPFATSRIIILQVARSARGGSPHPCLPQALTAVPTAAGGALVSGICLALHVASVLLADMPPGLAVSSTDSIIALPADVAPLPLTPGADGAAGLVVTVPLPLEQARAHGVCVPMMPPLGHGRVVPGLGRILYHGTDEQLRTLLAPDGTVPVYTGLLCLSARTAVRLLELHVRSPLDACTCLGIDSGAAPLKLDLHADVLAPLAATEEAWYLDGAAGSAEGADPRLQAAHRVLWSGLRGAASGEKPAEKGAPELGMLCLASAEGCAYIYLSDSAAHQHALLSPPIQPALAPTASATDLASLDATAPAAGWASPRRPPKPPGAAHVLCSFLSEDTARAWPTGT